MSLIDAPDRSDAVEEAFKAMRETKQIVYRQLAPQENDVSPGMAGCCVEVVWSEHPSSHQDQTYLVDKSELRRWIEEGLKKPAKAAENGDEASEPTNGNEEATVSGTPDGDADTRQEEVVGKVEIADVGNAKDDELPAPATLARTVQVTEPITRLTNSAVLCEHGHADPRKAEQMKRVSEVRSYLVCLFFGANTDDLITRRPASSRSRRRASVWNRRSGSRLRSAGSVWRRSLQVSRRPLMQRPVAANQVGHRRPCLRAGTPQTCQRVRRSEPGPLGLLDAVDFCDVVER